MAISKPPQYRYPLFDKWDRETFGLIRKLAKAKNYPKIVCSNRDKNQYLKTLIRTQKALHNWRAFLEDTMEQIKNTGSIDVKALIDKYPSESISKDTPDWVTYKEDKQVSDFMNELETREINFSGSDKAVGEFILRFILGQLGNDWELTIMMIREMLGEGSELKLDQLNAEMKNFDYARLFK